MVPGKWSGIFLRVIFLAFPALKITKKQEDERTWSWTTTIYTDLFMELKDLSEKTRIPVSKLTDEAIEDLLQKILSKEK